MRELHKLSAILLYLMVLSASAMAQITADSIAHLQGDALHGVTCKSVWIA